MILSPVDFSSIVTFIHPFEFILMGSAHCPGISLGIDPLTLNLREICRQAHPAYGKGVLDAKPKAKGTRLGHWDDWDLLQL